jgi:hypothetical protein
VKVNTPRAVMMETKKAFRKLPNLEQAITALSNLKGVGTTMASGENTVKMKYSATLSCLSVKLSDFSLIIHRL